MIPFAGIAGVTSSQSLDYFIYFAFLVKYSIFLFKGQI